MIFRRIVFGEPKPGEAQFAGLLSKLDESVSYCNRTGPLQHDRVTDLPFAIPALKLNFIHPTPLSFVSAAPIDNDPLGIFSFHHMALYVKGIESSLTPLATPHHLAAALCYAIYDKPESPRIQWDQRLETDGVAWGLKIYGKQGYVVFRGSDNLLDWIRDLVGFAPPVNHINFGQMWGGFVIGMGATWAAIKPLLNGLDEVVLTGHSLGAARADILCGYILSDDTLG